MTLSFSQTEEASSHDLKALSTSQGPSCCLPTQTPTFEFLPSPQNILEALPLGPSRAQKVANFRREIDEIVHLRSPRWLVIVGPCSVHDPVAAVEYATRLSTLSPAVSDVLLLVMRVYFEKPRTTIGWKGLINDPSLDGSFDVPKGLFVARSLLLNICDLSVPIACEFLDPFTPSYLSDAVAWGAIGARTCESQVHRELAATLPIPIGFKNGTEGCPATALEAIVAASAPQCAIAMHSTGVPMIMKTRGNSSAHLVLRGGRKGPNFDAESVASTDRKKALLGITTATLIDCSHGNSGKDWRNQSRVLKQVVLEQLGSSSSVRGVMLESNLFEGNQTMPEDVTCEPLKYGVSITDGCMGWAETERLIMDMAHALREQGLRNQELSDEASTGDNE